MIEVAYIVISSLRDVSFDVFVSRHIYAKALSTQAQEKVKSLKHFPCQSFELEIHLDV